MKRIFAYLIPALILLGVFAAMALKLRSNKQIAQERVYHFDESELVSFQSDLAAAESPGAVYGGLGLTGTFEPNKESRVSADIQGKINRVLVEAGSVVSRGQTLVQLDDALLQLQLQSVEVQIEGLEADVKRYSVLAKADAVQGVQLEKAELGLQSARIQRATIQEQINKTTITAPFGGIVVDKLNEEGGFAAPGAPLVHLMDISRLKFTVLVPERDLTYFRTGRDYTIHADTYPERALVGKISMIGSKANAGNSFPVQFTVQNFQNYTLKAGMFGKVTIPTPN